MSQPILIIDSANLFVRCYVSNPTMNISGELIGGTIGYIKSLTSLVKTLFPKRIIIVWESGGSARRLKIYPEYKQKRKPPRMSRFYGDAIPDSEDNKEDQMRNTIELLKELPIYQIYIENCEADDVIAYLCKSVYQNEEKIIVSSDKDFYQLLDDKTKIWNPGKKVFVKTKNVIDEYNISPENFCLAKALNGDLSDNIPGVPNVGFKTLAKKFDFLSKKIELENILSESKEQINKSKKPLKIYKNIIDYENNIRRNLELVTLDNRLLSYSQVSSVLKILNEYKPKWNKMKFWKKYLDMELDGIDVEAICNNFSYLVYSNNK